MRIAVVNHASRKVGGAESYLSTVIPALVAAGHEVAFWHEWEGPADRAPISMPADAPRWSAGELGAEAALAALRRWRPDLLYAHGLGDPALEAAVQKIAPGVFLAHNYYGTCVSGGKTFQFPSVRPCGERFGAACLLRYYPRRCGGFDPRTMWQLFRTQSRRLELLPRYHTIVTLSEHIRAEYLKHGLAPGRVRRITPCIDGAGSQQEDSVTVPPPVWRLLFCGRVEPLKGVRLLLRTVANLPGRLGRPIHLTIAGDGPDRPLLEKLARSKAPHVSIEFIGWVGRERLEGILRETHLLVLPSVWPEPFGLVGHEAGRHGVPTAAFAVGGIPEWLHDGVNGRLAPGDPPSADGLAEAIVRCLRDPREYTRLRGGAQGAVQVLSTETHVAELLPILRQAAGTESRPLALTGELLR
jgi:glycosyltransferase involved in cell wall biosynthesis